MDSCSKFPVQVEWKGRLVAGFRRMSALERSPSAPPRPPEIERLEPSRHVPVTFEFGVSPDAAFAKWASSSQEPSDLVVRLYDEKGRPQTAFRIGHCVVTTFESQPSADGVAIARMGLSNEGWQRI